MDLAEEFIKYCVQMGVWITAADDVKFLNDMFDKGLIERLEGVLKGRLRPSAIHGRY